MLTSRTKRGTPLRSTLGMKTRKPQQEWILVADRSRLEKGPLEKRLAALAG